MHTSAKFLFSAMLTLGLNAVVLAQPNAAEHAKSKTVAHEKTVVHKAEKQAKPMAEKAAKPEAEKVKAHVSSHASKAGTKLEKSKAEAAAKIK